MDQNRNQDRNHREDGGDEPIPSLGGDFDRKSASDDECPEPEKRLDTHRDVEKFEIEHGETIAGEWLLAS